MTLSREQLDAIGQRCEKASEGPWRVHNPQGIAHIVDEDNGYILEGSRRRNTIRSTDADAAFIAHASTYEHLMAFMGCATRTTPLSSPEAPHDR
jgi:hypothetical protein